MTDTIFNTPFPYFLCGTLVGVSLVVVPVLHRWWRAALICAAGACAVVGTLEWATPDPFAWSDRLVVGGAVLVGIVGGFLVAAYVSWVRRVFRAANARISASP